MPRLKFSEIPRTLVECLDCCLDFTAPSPPFVTVLSLETAVPPTKVKSTIFCEQTALGSYSTGVNQCHLQGQSSLNKSCSDAINCNLLEPVSPRALWPPPPRIQRRNCELPAIGKSTLTAALPSEKMAIPCLPRQYG
ncbi:hypothetical protein C7212DRAFT_355817 [Tuber magnatum]|uniref:Uncharacterized protein n=1 Tax=Tuber magnatum TaxID=42249 RepID=A0A317T2F0_9PEZI|nr:hypothetical protein C7212DRAFT_355817 [Tuber magnatum]